MILTFRVDIDTDIANLEQSGSRISEVQSLKLIFSLIVTLLVTDSYS